MSNCADREQPQRQYRYKHYGRPSTSNGTATSSTSSHKTSITVDKKKRLHVCWCPFGPTAWTTTNQRFSAASFADSPANGYQLSVPASCASPVQTAVTAAATSVPPVTTVRFDCISTFPQQAVVDCTFMPSDLWSLQESTRRSSLETHSIRAGIAALLIPY